MKMSTRPILVFLTVFLPYHSMSLIENSDKSFAVPFAVTEGLLSGESNSQDVLLKDTKPFWSTATEYCGYCDSKNCVCHLS